MLNIPSTVKDPNYRYRMPKMILKVESKGNGIKTNITNLPDIAKHLRTHQSYILKFFGFEKASQTTEKSSKGNEKANNKAGTSYIIQGEFPYEDLLKTLDKFIEKYILCPKCKLPEIHMSVANDRIYAKCDSCPFNGELDSKHRIASFIQKNPPTYKPQATKPQKIAKVVKEETAKFDKIEEQQITEIQSHQSITSIFSAETLEFGSEQMKNLITWTKEFIEKRKKDDFDIACAETVYELKSLKLKKSLYAYVLFNTFFTINIAKQLEQNGPYYQYLMKKVVLSNIQIETLLNLQYLILEENKDQKIPPGAVSTIMAKLHQKEIFSEQFLKEWINNEINDVEKLYLFNEERNKKFMELSQDFITYLTQDEEDQDQDD